jgi:hypothetical protein
MMEDNINGARFVIKFPDSKDGVYELEKNAKLINVNYKLFVPKFLGYFQILPTRKNKHNMKYEKAWKMAEMYAYGLRDNHPSVSQFIDLDRGLDTCNWRGSLQSKSDFFKTCVNLYNKSTKTRNEILYILVFIDHDEDTKDVFKTIIREEPNMTVDEFISSNKYSNFINYVKRNAQKFSNDIVTRLGLNTKTEKDLQSYEEVGRPFMTKFEESWILNQFKKKDDNLYCFHNSIPVQNKCEIIKIMKNEIHVPRVELPENFKDNISVFQVFENDFDLFEKSNKENNKITLVKEQEFLDIKPNGKYKSDNVNGMKILIPELCM